MPKRSLKSKSNKVVDIHHIGRKKLTKLKKSLNSSDFVDLLEYCLKSDQALLEDLILFWQVTKHALSSEDYVHDILLLICKIKLHYPAPTPPQDIPQPRTSEHGTKKSIYMEFVEEIDRVEKIRETYQDRYSWFYPSHCIVPMLEEIYPEELDPGRIIGRYLDQLFPDKYPEELNTLIYGDHPEQIYTLQFDSPPWHFLCELVRWVGEQFSKDNIEQTTFTEYPLDLLDPMNCAGRTSIFPIIKRFLLSHGLPSELFYAWINNYFLRTDEYDDLCNHLSMDEFKVALLLLSFCPGEPPLGLIPEFRNLKVLTDLNVSPEFEEYLDQGRCLPWQSFYILCSSDVGSDDEECCKLIQALVNSLSRFRQTFLGGIFPVSRDMVYCKNAHFFGYLYTEQQDLLILLADAALDCTILDLTNEKADRSYLEQIQFYNSQQELYLQLFAKAHAEGLYELGTSLLSLYLLYRALALQGRLNFSPEMLEAINKALQLPGAMTLKHTLEFAVECIDEYSSSDPLACHSAMMLRQFIPQGAQLRVLAGRAGQEGATPGGAKEAKAILMREIGEDRWEKLSANSRSCFVSAEIQWRNNAFEFGWGIRDWSSLITAYCKPIEGELVDRLSNFFVSPEYESYLLGRGRNRPAKPTAGWLLQELRSYESMPEELKSVLAKSRITIAGNKDLVNGLYDISQNYRNIAAHHNAVSMKKFAEFKEKMFQSGLLLRFIDAFTD